MGYWSSGYYYRNRRKYVGAGGLGELAEALDVEKSDQTRRQRDHARELELNERQEFQAARRDAARVDVLVKAGLEAGGYHRVSRHQWQRRRETMAKHIESSAVAKRRWSWPSWLRPPMSCLSRV